MCFLKIFFYSINGIHLKEMFFSEVKPKKLADTSKQSLVVSSKADAELFEKFVKAKEIPIDDETLAKLLEEITEGEEIELREKTKWFGVTEPMTSIFGKLKSKYKNLWIALFVAIFIWNTVIAFTFFIRLLIYMIGHLDLISWGVPGFRIPIVKFDIVLTFFLYVFIHIFSYLFVLMFSENTSYVSKVISIFLFTATIITLVCSILAKIALIIIEWGFVYYNCRTIVSIVTCDPQLTVTLIINIVFMGIEGVITLIFIASMIIIGLLRAFNIYEISPRVFAFLSPKKANIKKPLLEDNGVQTKVYSLASKYGYDKIINRDYSETPPMKEEKIPIPVKSVDTREKIEPNTVGFYEKKK